MLRIIKTKQNFKKAPHHLKSFCTTRVTLKERKRQPSEWENKCLQQMFKIMNSSPNMQTAHAAHDKAAKKNPYQSNRKTVKI